MARIFDAGIDLGIDASCGRWCCVSRLVSSARKRPLARRSRFGRNPFGHYRLFISEKARQQLRAFEKPIRRNIGHRMELCATISRAMWRNWRLNAIVLFTLEGDQIAVYAVNGPKGSV